MRKFLASLSLVAASLSCVGPATAEPTGTFHFESILTLDDMAAFIRERFPLGTSRDELRRAFVSEGQATLKLNPNEAEVEKYLYDIDLRSYYVWRWNISSDYDSDGKLLQAYINGNIVFPNGRPKKTVAKAAKEGQKASIFRMQRARPEAYKGERSLAFMLFDLDSDLRTTNDQIAVGAGPSRADAMDMGRLIVYIDVDPWRSIFDSDSAERIIPYAGDCAKVDKRAQAGEHPRAQ
jgi:hypothetical protein